MKSRTLLILSLLGAIAHSPAQSPAPQRPNFLVITYEDTSANRFGPNDKTGFANTPAVDRLAREGVNYTQYFGIAAVCAPNRSCWITGIHPNSLGSQNMRSDAGPLEEVVTYPELLRKAGYFTSNNAKTDYNFAVPKGAWDVLSTKAHWRDRKDPSQPFFSVFNLEGMHQGRVQSDDAYAKSGGKLPAERKADRSKVTVPPWLPDTAETREAIGRTWDNVNFSDRHVASLLKQLEEDGLLDSTWVIFMSDHGDGGYPRAKTYLYDSGLHSGLVIRPPGGQAVEGMPQPGSSDDSLVSFADFPSTVLKLAGINPPAWHQGRPLIGKDVPPAPEAVTAARDRINGRYDCVRAVRTGKFKYIRNYQPWKPLYQEVPGFEVAPAMQALRAAMKSGNLPEAAKPFCAATRPAEELYDITKDPDELHNLAADPAYAKDLEAMRAHLANRYKTQGDLGFMPEGMMDKMGKTAGSRRALLKGSSYDTVAAEKWAGFDQISKTPDSEIAAALSSGNPVAQYHACIAIGNRSSLPSGVDVPALEKLLASDYGDLAAAAAWALIKTGNDRSNADAALTRVIKEGTWQERLNALNLIDYLGPLAEPLLPLVQETGRSIRERMKTDKNLSSSDRYCAEQAEVTLRKRGLGADAESEPAS
ncbi:MAG: sulfatase [Chthoniobacterales bacterium]|nr:sulfatase [Chthoniobacterales bacterium]